MNILLVDDDPLVRSAFVKVLKRERWNVFSSDSVASAKAALDQSDIHLCITDIALPDGNGGDLIRYIRNTPRWADMPIIVLSGFAAESQSDIIALKPHAFYQKPVNIEDLCWAVRDALKNVRDKTVAS